MITLLDDAGAEVVHVPAVAFDGAEDWTEADSAIERLAGFRVIAFTSVNGVDFFMQRLLNNGLDARSLASTRIAAIGPATAAALNRHGLSADLVPGRFTTPALADAIAAECEQGATVLLPRGNLADDALPMALREHGLAPTPIVVYRTLPGPNLAERAKTAIERGIDAVLLTSPSSARNLVEALGDDRSMLGRDFLLSPPAQRPHAVPRMLACALHKRQLSTRPPVWSMPPLHGHGATDDCQE